MKLQIDSTVIYGIENFNGNLTKNDLRKVRSTVTPTMDCPLNLFQHHLNRL